MCRIENSYIPPGPTQYEQVTRLIHATVQLQYFDEGNHTKTIEGVLEKVEVHHNAEYLVINQASIRLDRVIHVSRG